MLFAALAIAAAAPACDEEEPETESAEDDDDSKKKKKKKDDAAASASVSNSDQPPGGDNKPASTAGGPTITIPAGTLRAGSRCYDIPRVRPNELLHTEVALGAFEMDTHPYPNDPGQPAKLGATWKEAQALCEARGKRLCTELEWERACKGTKNRTYMWGEAFKKEQCDGRTDHLTNHRPECKTEEGVMDMLGLGLEWTGSDWERGTPTGQKVVRGARAEVVSWLSGRCSHARQRDPSKSHDNVGFRCCKGEENSARVQLRRRQLTTIEEEPGIDTPFEMMLMKAMPKDHRGTVGITLSFDKVWRWHPVANEEMIIARWKGEPDDGGGAFYEIGVFKVCGNMAYRAASMRGPVERTSKPKIGVRPTKLSFDLTTGSRSGELAISYWHGYVKMTEPAFVKKGNQLKVSSKKRRVKTSKRRRVQVKKR